MLRDKITVACHGRFRFGWIDDILLDPAPLDHFPPLEALCKIGVGAAGYKHNKFHLNAGHAGFFDHLGPWRALYDWLHTEAFNDWCELLFGVRGVVKKSKFEFSALPADGGYLEPHPDTTRKLLTLVVYCGGYPAPTEFEPEPGIWFDAPWKIGRASWMIRNDYSWHRVSPIKGPAGEWRRTVTINLTRERHP